MSFGGSAYQDLGTSSAILHTVEQSLEVKIVGFILDVAMV